MANKVDKAFNSSQSDQSSSRATIEQEIHASDSSNKDQNKNTSIENETSSNEQNEFDDLIKSLTLNEEDLKILNDLNKHNTNNLVEKLSNTNGKVDSNDLNLLINLENNQDVDTFSKEETISIGIEKEAANPDLLEHLDTNLMKERNSNKTAITLSDPETVSSLNEDSVECFYDTTEIALPNENQIYEREKLSSISLSFQSTNEGDFSDLNSKSTFEDETNKTVLINHSILDDNESLGETQPENNKNEDSLNVDADQSKNDLTTEATNQIEENLMLEQILELNESEKSNISQNTEPNVKENNQNIEPEILNENTELSRETSVNQVQSESQNSNETNNNQIEQQASISSEENSRENLPIQIIDFQHEWDQLSDNEKMLGLLAPVWLPDTAAG